MNGIMTSRYADREHILQEFGGLIIAYNHYSNDPPAFLASAQYQSHLSSLPPIPPLLFRSHYSTSSTPSPASRDPNSPLNQTTFPAALDPFLDFPPPEHDTDCRLLLPPSCSPNACSGRPPIEKNRLLAEKLVVGLLCFEYYFKLLDDDSNLRVASAMAVAITLGSMEVSTEEDQRRASAALPKVLVAIAYRRHDGGTDEKWMEEDTVLAMAVFRHQAQLVSLDSDFSQVLDANSIISAADGQQRCLSVRLRSDVSLREAVRPGQDLKSEIRLGSISSPGATYPRYRLKQSASRRIQAESSGATWLAVRGWSVGVEGGRLCSFPRLANKRSTLPLATLSRTWLHPIEEASPPLRSGRYTRIEFLDRSFRFDTSV